MLWLAPPVLFTAGLGIRRPSDNDSFSFRPDPELFVDTFELSLDVVVRF
jgi:hypothetical protein